MSQEIALQVEDLVSQASELYGSAKIKLLAKAVKLADQGGLPAEEVSSLYLQGAEADPADPTIFWHGGRGLTQAEVISQIQSGLEARAAEDPDSSWTAHLAMFSSSNIEEDRRLDSTLRDLARKSSDAFMWQVYRFVDQDKWRNVQQSFTDQANGDRVEGARQTAYFAQEMGADTQQLADLWKAVYQSNRDDIEAQEALVPLYRDLAKWKDYAEVYKRLLDGMDEDDESRRREAIEGLIEVYTEHLKSDQILTDLYGQLFDLDPSNEEVAELLQEKYGKLRKWQNVLDILQTRTDLLEVAESEGNRLATERRLELMYQRADILLNQLRKADDAQYIYEAIVSEQPNSKASLEALSQIYERKRDWDNWAETRLNYASALDDPSESAELLRSDAATVEKKIRQPELALKFWERALDFEDEPSALLAIASIYESNQDWSALDDLITKIEQHPDVDDSTRVTWLQKGGSIAIDGLSDSSRALERWYAILNLENDHKKALDLIKKTLMSEGQWDELIHFFGERGDWADIVKSLESHANQAPSDEEKVELYFRAAEIWEHELSQEDKAQRALERVLQVDPENVKAAERLAMIYRSGEQQAKLASVLEVILNASPVLIGVDSSLEMVEETLPLIFEITELYEESLRKPQQAFEWVSRLLAIAPHELKAWGDLIRLAGSVRPPLHADAIRLLSDARERAAGQLDPEHERDLCLQLAEISREELKDLEQALYFNNEALSIDPQCLKALRNLESIFEESSAWERVVEVLTTMTELTEAEERESVLFKMGQLYQSHLGLSDQAIDAYNSLLELNSNRRDAVEALHVLYREQQDSNALYEIINREIELISSLSETSSGESTLGLELELAVLEIDELDKVDSAIERLRQILVDHPSQPVAVRSLEQIQENPTHGKDAALLLIDVYREREEWAPYVHSLSVIARDTVDSAYRVSLFEEMGSIYLEKLNDYAGAQSAYISLLREQADHESAIGQLYHVVEQTGDWHSFVHIYEETIHELGELDKEVHHLLALAEVYEERLGDANHAIRTYQRVYAAASDCEPALLALERLYTQTEDFRSLLEILRARYELSLLAPTEDVGESDQSEDFEDSADHESAEHTSRFSSLSESLLIRIADLYEVALNEPHEAIASHQELLAYLPERLDSLSALSRLFESVGQWSDFVQVTEELTRHSELDASVRFTSLMKLAESFYQHLERYDEVLRVIALILESSAQDPTAIAYLEQLVQIDDYKVEAAHLLSPIYEQTGQAEYQIFTLSILADAQDESDDEERKQKLSYLHRIANLYLDAGAIQEAYDSYQRAFFVIPSSSETLDALTQIVSEANSWGILAQTYEQLIPQLEDPILLAQRAYELGLLFADKLSESERAIVSYEHAKEALAPSIEALEFNQKPIISSDDLSDEDLDLGLTNEHSGEESLELNQGPSQQELELIQLMTSIHEALAPLYSENARWAELMELSISRVTLLDLTHSRSESVEHLILAAKISVDHLEEFERAIDLYREILNRDAQHLESLDALERLYSAQGDWTNVIEIIEFKKQLDRPELSSSDLTLSIAQVQVHHLGDLESAIVSYLEVLEIHPDHVGALRELAEVYMANAQAEQVVDTLDTLANLLNGEEKIEVQYRAATLVNSELDTPQVSIERLQALLADAPQHEQSFVYLEGLIDEQREAVLASEVLTASLRQIGDFGRLVNTWRRLLNVTEDPNEQAALWMKVGQTYQEIFLDDISAFEAYSYALRSSPLTEGTYSSMLKIVSQTEGAWPRLAEELEIAISEVQNADLERIGGEATLVTLHRWLAKVYEEQLSDDVRSIEHWTSVRALSDSNDEALISLERLYERNGLWEELAEVLRARVELLETKGEISAAINESVDEPADEAEGFDAESEGFDAEAEGFDAEAKTSAEGFDADELDATLMGDEILSSELNEVASEESPQIVNPMGLSPELEALKLSLLQKLARVYAECLHLTDEAIETYREVFELNPVDQEAMTGLNALFYAGQAQEEIALMLEPIYRVQASWQALYQQKQTLLALRMPGEERRVACQELASLSLEYLEDVQSALGWLGEGFKEEPHNEECRKDLHSLAIDHGFASALVMLYEEARSTLSDPETMCNLSIHIANVHLDSLHDWESAEREFNLARQLNEDRLDLFVGLDRVYSTLERWDALEDVILQELRLVEQGAAETGEGEIERLYWRLADLYEYRLDRPENAVDVFQNIMSLQPEELGAAQRLETLYRGLGRFDELAEIYLFQGELLEGDDLIETRRQLARLSMTELDRPYDAIDQWKGLLAEIPQDEESLNALEKLYEKVEQWRDLIEICETQLHRVTGHQEHEIYYLSRLGHIWGELLDRPQSAISSWEKVIVIDPESVDARWAMRELYRRERDEHALLKVNLELLQLLDDLISRGVRHSTPLASQITHDPTPAPVLDQQLADVERELSEQLSGIGDLESEQQDLERLTPSVQESFTAEGDQEYAEEGSDSEYHADFDEASSEPTNIVEQDESAEQDVPPLGYELEVSQADLGEDEPTPTPASELNVTELNVTEALEAEARLELLKEKRAEVLRELADLYLNANDEENAIQALTLRLEAAPSCFQTMEDLESLYEMRTQWDAYCDVLQHRATHTISPEDRVSIFFKLAESREAYLQDLMGATVAYQQVLQIDPYNQESFEHLERLLTDLERWSDLVNTLNHRLQVSQEREEQLAIALRISEIHESQDNAQDALIVLGQAFSFSPDDEALGEQIEKLAAQTEMWSQAVQLYEASIAEIGAMEFETIPLRMRVARWYDEALGQPQHAVTHYQSIQQIDPDHLEVLFAQENLYVKHGQWQFAAQIIEMQLQRVVDLDDGKEAWKKLARIRKENLEDFDGALSAYQEVLNYDPDDLASLGALKELYAMRQDFTRLIEVLERESELHESPETKVENLLRIAEIKEVRLNDVDGAILAYHDAFEVDSNCVDALLSLEQLYRQQKNVYELQKVYEALIVARTGSIDQLKNYSKLATLQLEEMNDREAAIDTYRKMFYIDAQYPEVMPTLDRLYREDSRWDELKDIYDQYLQKGGQADHTMVRLVLSDLCELVYHEATSAREQAISYLLPIIDRNPHHLEALNRLSLLHGQLGRWAECVQFLSSELEAISDLQGKIEKMYHLGMVHIEHLDDPTQAIEWMKRALELNPTYSPAMIALKDIYESNGDYQDVIRIFMMMEAQATTDIDKSKCYFEMGRIYAQLLGDNNTGLEYYSRSIDLDPTNVDVAPYLIEVYLRDERWEKAKPLLELLISREDLHDLGAKRQNHFNLAFCAQQLRLDELALEHYQHSYQLDSTHFQTLEGLAEVYLRRDDWEGAANMLQAILIHHGERLAPEAKVEVMFKQGKAKFMLGDDRRTLDLLMRVIETEPNHLEALNLLIETYERREKWEESIYYRQRRMELSDDSEARFDSLVDIGKIYNERLGQKRQAITMYENALQINEYSRLIFGALLPLYEEVEDWQSTVQLLTHFAANEQDGPTRAKYHYAIGALQRDHIQDNLQAVRSFDKALDANPAELKAFTAIEELLAKERNFERQDRYFRKMLKRATENSMGNDMIFELAKALGEINRTRLGNFSEAVKAYNIALSKRPGDIATHTVIAELHEHEQKWEQAIAQHREILRLDIRQIGSLHKLFRLFIGQGRYDEAWCVAQALVCLRHAREDEQQFYSQHFSRRLGDIRKHLENDHWSYLVHPKKSPLMDRLFERLYPYNAPAMMTNHKLYGVHRRKDLLQANEQTAFNSVLDFVSRVTRFERLSCYAAPSGTNGLRAMNIDPPAILIGQDMQKSVGMKTLAFSISKLLFMMTPHALMATLDLDYDSRRNRLKVIIFTLMRMAGIEVADFDAGLVDVYRKIDDTDLGKINTLLNEMQTDQRTHLDVSRWLEGLDHTANRLGFVLCNDLVEATQAIRNETMIISRADVSDRIQELIRFSISDEYFALRRGLGITIKTS